MKDGDGDASVADLKWSDVTPWKLIVADSFATVVEKSLLFPIDTLRTRMQVTTSSPGPYFLCRSVKRGQFRNLLDKARHFTHE